MRNRRIRSLHAVVEKGSDVRHQVERLRGGGGGGEEQPSTEKFYGGMEVLAIISKNYLHLSNLLISPRYFDKSKNVSIGCIMQSHTNHSELSKIPIQIVIIQTVVTQH